MTWEFNGLPIHILLIHFVVIVVPLAGLCTVLAAAWPAARRRLGIVTALIALAALIAVPIGTDTPTNQPSTARRQHADKQAPPPRTYPCL